MSNVTDQVVSDNLGKMTRATLLAMINNIQKQARLIPDDQKDALKCVEMCLSVIEQYECWVMGLKSEILKMNEIIKQQGKRILELNPKVKIISPDEVC